MPEPVHQDPGHAEGLPAIEESIFAGVPINVTLLFSRDQYVAAAEAYIRGLERRVAAGLNPTCRSVASVFVSRWDKAVMGKVAGGPARPARHRGRQADLPGLPRAARLAALAAARERRRAPAAPALGEHRDEGPGASDVLYVEALAAPHTVNTMPEETLLRSPTTARCGPPCRATAATPRQVLDALRAARRRRDALAAQLQKEGAEAFVKSWNELLGVHRGEERVARRKAG